MTTAHLPEYKKMMRTCLNGGEPNKLEPNPESAKLVEKRDRFRSGVSRKLPFEGHWILVEFISSRRFSGPLFFIISKQPKYGHLEHSRQSTQKRKKFCNKLSHSYFQAQKQHVKSVAPVYSCHISQIPLNSCYKRRQLDKWCFKKRKNKGNITLV